MHLYLLRVDAAEAEVVGSTAAGGKTVGLEWNRLRFGGLLQSIIDKCLAECSLDGLIVRRGLFSAD